MTAARFDSYVVCTSPRSGSTLLCRLLAATGVAGKPESYFHRPSVAAWVASLGVACDRPLPERDVLQAVFRAAIARGRDGTGVFGLRLQRHSFAFFVQKLAILYPDPPRDAVRFRAAFGRTLFVHLTRGDKIDQAVSYVRADQSGLWHKAPDGTALERRPPAGEVRYDPDAIQARLIEMTAMDRAWNRWFAGEGIDPLRLDYGALAADPAGTLAEVLDRLGLDRKAAAGVEPGVAKLADDVSRAWAARFRTERGWAADP